MCYIKQNPSNFVSFIANIFPRSKFTADDMFVMAVILVMSVLLSFQNSPGEKWEKFCKLSSKCPGYFSIINQLMLKGNRRKLLHYKINALNVVTQMQSRLQINHFIDFVPESMQIISEIMASTSTPGLQNLQHLDDKNLSMQACMMTGTDNLSRVQRISV